MQRKDPRTSGYELSGIRELLALGMRAEEAWSPEEQEAAFAEQLSLPLQFDLSGLSRTKADDLRSLADSEGLLLKSLNTLLSHPLPPLELLVMAKEFFKANTVRPSPGLSDDVARALYYLAVAVAYLRHGERITTLTDIQLMEGLFWVAGQNWVTPELRNLATLAHGRLNAGQQTPTRKD